MFYLPVISILDLSLGIIRSSNLPFAADSDSELLLLEFLSQHNSILNDKNRLLDLMLVSEDLIYEICDPIECIFKKSIHHSPIVIDLGIIEFYNCRLSKIDVFTIKQHIIIIRLDLFII